MPKPANYINLRCPSRGEVSTASLGIDPAILSKRYLGKQKNWCPTEDIEFDPWCDENNPKTITYKDILKAATAIREDIPKTIITRSRRCAQMGLTVYYKLENSHRTGSFNERGALYSLKMLSEEERNAGVITASSGNWALALAYHGSRLNVPVTAVMPANTLIGPVEKCREFGATVILHGENFAQAKHQAFIIMAENGSTYINGYDHPHVIAASGTIGLEIIDEMPETDAILVPVGGGGLIAGIAEAAKHLKPDVLIYGIEPEKCCSFYKAMENELPYSTKVGSGVAESLAISTVGYNAFHTAQSLIDKMVLVDDDWITRAVLHLVEEEKMVAECAGAASLSPLLSNPNVLPELQDKTVVCVITGGNIDNVTLPRCLERAKTIEGRLIKLTVTLPAEGTKEQLKIFSIIANVGCNVINFYTEKAWLLENDLNTIYLNIICETRNLEHACTLKRVMQRLFPNICEFLEEPYSPIPYCTCYPKRKYF